MVWGKLIDLLEWEDEYEQAALDNIRKVAIALGVKEDQRENYVGFVMEWLPYAVAYSGLAATLSSHKLRQVLTRCFDNPDSVSDPGASTMGALLGFEQQEAGWPKLFQLVRDAHPQSKGVTVGLERFALFAYYYQTLRNDDLAALRDFIADQLSSKLRGSPKEPRKVYRGRILHTLDKNRELLFNHRLAYGIGALDGLAELWDGVVLAADAGMTSQ